MPSCKTKPNPVKSRSSGKTSNPGTHRKHTPIVSKKQRGLMGAEYARRKAGKSGTMQGITKTELKSHLKESGGKKLPAKVKNGKK